MNTIVDEQELITALADLKMDAQSSELAIGYFRQRQMTALKKLLAGHRGVLLADLHEGQNRLYQLDYIMKKLK